MKNILFILFALVLFSFTYLECKNCAFYKAQYLELLKKTSTCEELLIENETLTHEILDQKAHIKVLRELVNSKLK
jgi:hypothetical protein